MPQTVNIRRRVRTFVLLSALLAGIVGCKVLTPFLFVGEHKKRVTAEFDKLAHSRVAILVWVDQAALFDYPYARFELATYLRDKLAAETAQRNMGTEVVDSRSVEDYLQKNLDAQIDAHAVGKQFAADYVVYVEVLEFQIRDPRQPQFLQGRIGASVTVHQITAGRERTGRFELTPVQSVYPDNGPVLFSATNSPAIRESTYRKFAEEVARKFYDHTVDL
ncbi:MAG: hypothetical protein HY763_03880 [Planctomycetes bacterium]|nr:hypothetical protein [Planctomycetota bacterium]